MAVVEAKLKRQAMQQHGLGGVAVLEDDLVAAGAFAEQGDLAPEAVRGGVVEAGAVVGEIGRVPLANGGEQAGAGVGGHVVHEGVGQWVGVAIGGKGGFVLGEERVERAGASECMFVCGAVVHVVVEAQVESYVGEGGVEVVGPGQRVKVDVVEVHGLARGVVVGDAMSVGAVDRQPVKGGMVVDAEVKVGRWNAGVCRN